MESTPREREGRSATVSRAGPSIPAAHQETAGMGNRHRDPTAFQPREEREPCGSRVTRSEGAWARRTLEAGKLDPYSDIRS